MEPDKMLADVMSKFLTGYALSKALLEDYAKVVAKLEGITEQEVKDRVQKRMQEIFEEATPKQPEDINSNT